MFDFIIVDQFCSGIGGSLWTNLYYKFKSRNFSKPVNFNNCTVLIRPSFSMCALYLLVNYSPNLSLFSVEQKRCYN